MKKLLFLFIALFTFSLNFSQIPYTKTNASCPGTCDGTIVFSLTAPGPYTVNWGGCSTSTTNTTFSAGPITFPGLCPCGYSFSFYNSTGWIGFSNITITAPTPMNAAITKTNACCNGSCNGVLNAFVFGGTSPYTYTWSPFGAGTASVSNLCAGNYTLLIKDNNGCAVSYTSSITQPAPLTTSTTKTLTSSSSACDGQINSVASGGSAPYTYSLSPGSVINSTGTFTNLCNGNYTLCVSDNSCCVICSTVSISTSTVTGIQNNSLISGMEIYPNPTSEKITFKTELKNIFVEVLDARGKVVKQEKLNENTLNVSDIAEGIYILNIRSGDATLRKQIVIGR